MPGTGDIRTRYRRILRFAGWNLAVTWWFELVLPRIGLGKLAERTRSRRMRRFAQRFHVLAVELGGLMIKVGQFMSSRLDVLPPEITAELEGLQDEVPPVPFAAIRALAEAELGVPLQRAFATVDETPVAAASLGQAHRARLAPLDATDTGLDAVVIKVQRPNIDAIIDVDLAALRKVGGWLSRVRIVSDRVDMPALVEEFAQTSLEEIDYLHEAASSERFATEFADDERVSVPAIVWERTTRRVLTLEDVTAIKITDTEALAAAGIDPAEVAPVFAAVMFDQLFTNGFFHADPHPGNIFVTPVADGPAERPWKLTFIDFGMMGEVPPSTRSGLRKLLIAAASRDGTGMVEAIREVGVLLPSAETSELERAMTQLFARFGGMGFAELREVDPREFREFADQFGHVVRSLPFQLPENFLLIIRAMSLTSGVCSALDPAFNLWSSIEPYAAQLLRDESGNVVQDLAQQAFETAGIVWRLPKRLDAIVTRVEDGSVSVASPRLERRVARLERTARRLVSAVLFGALLIGGAVLHANDAVLGTVLMVASIIPLLHALFAGLRDR
ncbi:ABC1 kinase family protein [Compostimonas suwonensis]|uniref:Putative unusual protein kinase regulating ubiquinone biosynthesis (AarF/ABC1/UbiB family) n=1 Tax=Compostimonas suwonensis TaxID=1048394 RepID=A0A2M9C0I4_9MICO|nr:AarF/UbiB family protein [Compostimonas suwonensis]PJJ63825.1 putative unusual protein kinase regulating ubiquinone biosynthesis (AarF/ABC1/UbiB family) [Compostimonas suwonensis]